MFGMAVVYRKFFGNIGRAGSYQALNEQGSCEAHMRDADSADQSVQKSWMRTQVDELGVTLILKIGKHGGSKFRIPPSGATGVWDFDPLQASH